MGSAKWEETVSMGVTLSKRATHTRFDKKTVKFTLLEGEKKLGETELNVAQYATGSSTEEKEEASSESAALPFPLAVRTQIPLATCSTMRLTAPSPRSRVVQRH